MKYYLILIFVIVCINASGSDIRLFNLCLTEPDSAVLYRYYDNRIFIDGILDTNNLKVFLNRTQLNLIGNTFWINPKLDSFCQIKLYKGNRILLTRTFRVLDLPEPEFKLGKYNFNWISFQEIQNCPSLACYFPKTIYIPGIFIWGFDFTIERNGKIVNQCYVKGSTLKEELVKEIISGDKIFLENIKASASGTCPRSFGSKILTIK